MMTQLSLSDEWSGWLIEVRPDHLVVRFSRTIMLMVGPNQGLQRRPKSTEKLSWTKSTIKNYLVKQLVNEPTHGCTWVS